jgi:uncharacterized phiE125 gp8 family phage protein
MTTITILEEDNQDLPLDLSQIKSFLKVDYEEDVGEDDVITRAFKTAINQCESKINKSIIKKIYAYSVCNDLKSGKVQLFYGTVIDIIGIKIVNKNNEMTTINENNYFLDSINNCVVFKNIPSNFYRLDITYEAKFDSINDEIMQAILFHTAKIYEDKTGYCQIPRASLNIYKKYREIML